MEINIIFSILIFLGIFFTALPTTPGMLYMLILTIIYGVITDFSTIEPKHFLLFVGLVIVAMLTDYSSGLIGAKFGGANKKSILSGFIGMILGLVVFPPLGLFIGLFLGVFLAELFQFADHKKAWKAASTSFIASIIGMLINIIIAITYFIAFLILIF